MESAQNTANHRLSAGQAACHGVQPGGESKKLGADRFLSNLTHVLRTPMIGILGSIDLLEHTRLDPDQLRLAEDIRDCGETLLNNIDDVLEWSRLKYGLAELELVPTNLSEAIPLWTSAFGSLLQKRGFWLELDLDESLPFNARLDQGKLKRVVSNLLFNILENNDNEGIRVSARAIPSPSAPGRLLIIIASIAAPAREAASELAAGLAEPPEPKPGITLGMLVCQYLIESMGGELRIRSHPGAGNIYEVMLPLEVDQLAGCKSGSESAPLPSLDDEFMASFNPVSILLVDDNELNQKLIGQMLTNYGFEVITAANGLEALYRMEQKSFDLVLMDMQMPRMDGYETTRRIRATQAWAKMPVIAITANSLPGDRDKCLACGCTSYLAKPFRSDTLIREVKYLLHNEFIKDKQADLYSRQIIVDLLPEFMDMLGEMLAELRRAIKTKNDDAIKHISHSLKGTAGMYGFMKISDLALSMERAVAGQNYGKLASLCHQITALAKESQSRLSNQDIV